MKNTPSSHDILRTKFGFSDFRPGQEQIVDAVLAGRDCIGVLPTGAGKSLCYQLPALVRGGLTLVVSPLIALMKDQVDALRARDIEATLINSTLGLPELQARQRGMAAGRYRLVYVAPERFRNQYFREAVRRCRVDVLAIDEAHCLSMWGHDFRPDYLSLSEVIPELGDPQVLALTATATRQVRSDLVAQLGLGMNPRSEPVIVVSGFARPELTFGVRRVRNHAEKRSRVLEILADHSTGIIYCSTRANVEKVAAQLLAARVNCVAYHAGLSDDERRRAQERFIDGRVGVAVATNAFGMGIDRADLRTIIHWDMPGSLEAYYQEAGRAGRDGQPAHCELLFNFADVYTQESFLRGEQAERDKAKLRQFLGFINSRRCRHQLILDYFGDPGGRSNEGCQACDNCLGRQGVFARPLRTPDEQEWIQIQKVLSCATRMRGRYGQGKVAQVLAGSRSKELLRTGLQDLPTYGALKDIKLAAIRQLIEALLDGQCLAAVGLEYPLLEITPLGRRVMKREQDIQLALPERDRKTTPRARRSRGRKASGAMKKQASNPAGESEESNSEQGALILEALRTMRTELARERGVPAYLIYSNATMQAIAAAAPRDEKALLAVKGIGPAKLEDLGEKILETVALTVDV